MPGSRHADDEQAAGAARRPGSLRDELSPKSQAGAARNLVARASIVKVNQQISCSSSSIGGSTVIRLSTRLMPGASAAARSAMSRCSHVPTWPVSVTRRPPHGLSRGARRGRHCDGTPRRFDGERHGWPSLAPA